MTSDNLIRMVGHFGRLDHGVRVATVYLDADRGFFIKCLEFRVSLFRISDQAFGWYELGVDHVRPLLPANTPEGCVCHVLHWSQKNRLFSQIDVPYPHFKYDRTQKYYFFKKNCYLCVPYDV